MAKINSVFTVKKRTVILTVLCFAVCIGLILLFRNVFSHNLNTPFYSVKEDPEYVILAVNDLGMHCYQSDYSAFLILPPGNNLKVQVFKKGGEEAELITSGIKISYEIIDNTTSADKINFWEYAADYGFNVAPNIGITGNGLQGEMQLSADGKYYIATAIPVTPFNDGSKKLNPFQLAYIDVTDAVTGKVLAKTDNVVVPVSDEMDCNICHGTTDTSLNILKAHDELSGTKLVNDLANGKRHKCSDCHKDNILNQPGESGVLPLSEAMHGFHADKMVLSKVKPECYSCHPGPVTKCYRGVMSTEVSCVNSKCHGDMNNIAKTQAEGRQAWLDEPDCGTCHGAEYEVNPGVLYRESYLINNANPEMNGFILCESCHNGPHAEWKSTKTIDNLLPIQLQGHPNFIDKCTVCHTGKGKIHQKLTK